MADIYYAERSGSSEKFVAFVLDTYYGYRNVRFFRERSGKPRCDAPLNFSLSHTKKYFFLSVSKNETGIDAEDSRRTGNFSAILSRLDQKEKSTAEKSPQNFLRLWTMREALAKYLSLPVFSSLKRLALPVENDLSPILLDGAPVEAIVHTFFIEEHFVSVCTSKGETTKNVNYVAYSAKNR